MIAPTFEPNAEPGAAMRAYTGGVDKVQSWMDRAQAQQLRAQEIQENIDMAPVRALKRDADRRTYEATITNAGILEATRKEAAEQAPQYLAEFLEITKIADFDEKARQLDAFAAKTAWLANMPENKQFIEQVKHTQGQAHLDSIAMGKIEQAKQASRQRAETAETQIEGRAKAAEAAATSRVEMQARDLEHKREVDQLNLKIKEMETQTKQRGQDMSAQRPANAAAIKFNESLLTSGQMAVTGIRDSERALALLDDVRTGTGAKLQVSTQRLGQLLGVDTSTAKPEELQRLLGDAVLKRVNQTKGSISDKEMSLFDSYSASMNKSVEGNRAILTAYLAAQRRDLEIAKMVNGMRRDGLSEREIQLEVNDYIQNNPITADIPGAESGGGVVIKSVKKIE